MNNLNKKLQLKAGQTIMILNAPAYYQGLLEPLPENVTVSTAVQKEYNHVQLFVKNSTELAAALAEISATLQPDTVIWVMYPKKSSGIKSDLDMMNSWKEPEKYGLRPVSSASVDETWTALRLKRSDQVKKSGLGNSEIQNSEMSQYLDVTNKVVTLPPDLKAALTSRPDLLLFFESLAWSHKKEYVIWILSAKQEKTRADRVQKTIEMLASNKKNPNAK